MRRRIHACEPITTTRTMAVGRATRDHRSQATLLRATCWAAAVAAVLALGDRAVSQEPATVTFNPSATPAGASWNLGTNWSTGSRPTAIDTAVIGAANGDGLITLDANQSIAGLSYTKTGTTVLTGNALSTDPFRTLTLGTAGITMNANTGVLLVGGTSNSTALPDSQQIQLVLGGNQTWTNNSVTPRASSADPWSLFRGLTPSTVVDDFGAHTLTITGAGWTELRGRFTGTTASRIVMDGEGGVLAIGSNAGSAYAGSLEVKRGALGIANGSAVLGTGTLRITGGQIFPYLTDRSITNAMAWGGDFTVRDPRRDIANDFRGHVLTATGSTVLEKSVIVNVDNDGVAGTTVGGFSVGAIGDGGGNFGITKTGPGFLAFTGANTYGGNTTVTNGGLSIAQTGSLPGWDVPGRYSITGSTSYLAFGNAVTDANITTILGTGNVAADVSLGFNTTANRTYATAISGNRGLVKLGTAELTLSGANTYSGNTRVLQGTLRIANTSALPGWNSPGRVTVSSGAGLMVGNDVSTEDVATILSAGTFGAGSQIGYDTSLGNRTVQAITGDLGLLKAGLNTLTLAASGNTYTGATNVAAGTLLIPGTQTISSNIRAESGARITLDGDVTLTGPVFWQGTEGLRVSSGTSVIAGPMTLGNAANRLSVATGAKLTISGDIDRDGSNSQFIPTGGATNGGEIWVTGKILRLRNTNGIGMEAPATVYLLGENTFDTGSVNIDQGTIVANTIRNNGVASSLGKTMPLIVMTVGSNTTSTLRYIGGETSTDRQVRMRSTAAGARSVIEANGTGTLTFSNATFLSAESGRAAQALVLAGTNSGAIQGVIPDNLSAATSLVKEGSGRWTLSGANTYTGTTTVSAGTLLVNGTNSGTGAVTVASGATLGGTGQLAGATTVSGFHSPGASPGLQTFTNNLNYNATGSLVWELSGNTELTGDRGTVYDGVNVTGATSQLTINAAATLALVFDAPLANAAPSTVNFNNTFWDSDRTWQVISLAGGATGGSNVFGTISVGADAFGNQLTTVRPNASFSVASQPDGVYLVYSAVPEPTTTALLVVGAASLLGVIARNRRRRA